jgi:pimeloyl-ACP methyl ester carboxylesterase
VSPVGFRPRREPGTPVATSAGPVFVARRRAPGARRPPLVLLHGWLMAHGYFSALVDGLAGERELVLVDLPGYGESACPHPSRFRYDFTGFTGVLHEVLDALRLDEVDLLGHSLGGGVALRYAAVRERVRRLVVIDPLAYRIPEPLEARLLALPGVGRFLWQRAIGRRDFLRQMRRDVENVAVVGDAYVDWAFERFNRAGARAASYATFDFGRALDDDDIGARVRQKTLIIWGEADRLIPRAHGDRLRSAMRDAHLEIIPATGHTPFIERPGLVLDAIRRFEDAEAASPRAPAGAPLASREGKAGGTASPFGRKEGQ